MEKLLSEDKELETIMDELRSIVIPSTEYACDTCENNNQKVLNLLDKLKNNLYQQREAEIKGAQHK